MENVSGKHFKRMMKMTFYCTGLQRLKAGIENEVSERLFATNVD